MTDTMKYNEETGMELMLLQEIQAMLRYLNHDYDPTFTRARYKLAGIITALAALKDELWWIAKSKGKYVLLSENKCITESTSTPA